MVNSEHPEYQYYAPIWGMIDDFVLGEKQVKEKGVAYLPMNPEWTVEQYLEYRMMAPFTNFTVRTINALLGAMFIRDPLLKLPLPLEYLEDNADGRGNSLQQVVRRMALEAIKKGRSGVYVDFPRVEADSGERKPSIRETENLKSMVTWYDANDIINWKEDDNGLYLVTLREVYEAAVNDFKSDLEVRYKVLRKVNGVYTVEIWEDNVLIDNYIPTDYNRKPFDYIPFFFNGAVNNDATCDASPVYEIVSKNKTHYQLEAEIMRNIRLIGAPMMTVNIGDMPSQQFLELNGLSDGSPLRFGSSRGLILGSGGSANLLQANANDMAQAKAKAVLEEAMMLGARLVTKSSGRATAEQIRIETSAENAVINSIAKNIEHTMRKVLVCIQQFMTPTIEEFEFKMATEFYTQTADPQVLMFTHAMLTSGIIAPSDMLVMLKNNGIVDTNRTLEDIYAEANKFLNAGDGENDNGNTSTTSDTGAIGLSDGRDNNLPD